jgi:hypothetical protein
MRRLTGLVVLVLALVAPGAALGADPSGDQGVAVGQSGEATAVALTAISVDPGATCFAGCPTIVVAPTIAVAVSLNLAAVTQLLIQTGVQP